MRAIHASIGICGISVAKRRDEDDIRILRIDNDSPNLSSALESDVLPGLAGVDGFVHAVAELNRISHVGFARANVNHIRIRRRHTNGANRGRRRRVENGIPCATCVHRLPNAATNRAEIKSLRLAHDATNRVDAARAKRANHPPMQAGIKVGIVLLCDGDLWRQHCTNNQSNHDRSYGS